LVGNFLNHLRAAFRHVEQVSQLRRDPHLTAWFRSLCEHDPPLANPSRAKRLFCIRRLLAELAGNCHAVAPDLIRREDCPAHQRYFTRPLSVGDDRSLEQFDPPVVAMSVNFFGQREGIAGRAKAKQDAERTAILTALKSTVIVSRRLSS
jgi:hypothetical protein